jgi:hypothetical protein
MSMGSDAMLHRYAGPDAVGAVTELARMFDQVVPGERTGFAAFDCDEADQLARVMALFGHTGTAANVLEGHAEDCDGAGGHELMLDEAAVAAADAGPGECIDTSLVRASALRLAEALRTGEPVKWPAAPAVEWGDALTVEQGEWLRERGRAHVVGGDADWRIAVSVYLIGRPQITGASVLPAGTYVRTVEGKHEQACRVVDARAAIAYARSVEAEYERAQDGDDQDDD